MNTETIITVLRYVSVAVAGALVGLSVLSELLKRRFASRTERSQEATVQFANDSFFHTDAIPEIDYEADTRLNEARLMLRRQTTLAAWNRWTTHFLAFGQYVVGGVLATSFIQSELSKETVGFLGVLVLVSSLIHQRFRPDVQYRNAKERAAFLTKLIRKAEDEIFAIQRLRPNAKSVQDVRGLVSEGLSKTEASELNDVVVGAHRENN